MGRTILFSPVGGTNPIPGTNFQDGSLIHIYRHYQPDEVYLYMSAEILEHHEKDNRYVYCMEQVDILQNRDKCVIHIIKRPELKEVQDFDYFYEEFDKEIRKIGSKMEPDDRLFLNVSSGTPAMKSALLVIQTLGELSYIPIQVAAPERRMNARNEERGAKIEDMWELNVDNEPGAANRCSRVQCPTLSQMKSRQIIKELIGNYDYSGALEVARSIRFP